MSLKDELLKLADRLDQISSQAYLTDSAREKDVCCVAAELRGIAKAVNESQNVSQLQNDAFSEELLKMKARQQAQDERRAAQFQESTSGRMVDVEGGPADSTCIFIQGDVPENAYTRIAGCRYQYRQGKLHYAKE